LAHVHPAPGDTVAQPGFGGGGVGLGAGVGADGAVLPVVNIETPCPRSCNATVLATIRQ
jgi:hypothetical protein